MMTALSEEAQVATAIDLIALELVAELVDLHAGEAWERFPEVAELDWLVIVDRARLMARRVHPDDRAAALERLAARADPEAC